MNNNKNMYKNNEYNNYNTELNKELSFFGDLKKNHKNKIINDKELEEFITRKDLNLEDIEKYLTILDKNQKIVSDLEDIIFTKEWENSYFEFYAYIMNNLPMEHVKTFIKLQNENNFRHELKGFMISTSIRED